IQFTKRGLGASIYVRGGITAALVIGLIQAPYAAFGFTPNGGQWQVNTITTASQNYPKVASDSLGNFVVVWQSYASAVGGHTAPESIHAKRYSASGGPVGGEFQVNTYTIGSQRVPVVASDASGNFVVVWWNYGIAGTAGNDSSGSVQGQRYDASGTPIGS